MGWKLRPASGFDRLVQLKPRSYNPVRPADDHQPQAFDPAVNADEVHAIKRGLDKPRHAPLNSHCTADKIAHEAPDS